MACPARSRAHGRRVLAALLLLGITGCAGQTGPAPASEAAVPTEPVVASAPRWRPGDRWVYSLTGGAESVVKTVEVMETREINRVSFYLVRLGEVQYFYTRELQWAGSMQDGKVASRMTPPQPWFTWPLKVGARWTHRGTFEERGGATQFNDTFTVVAVEAVEVPAGRFTAFRIVRETERRDSDQYWYAPAVGFYVKWIGRRGDAQFEEQLREYHPAPRLIPSEPPPAPPSTTR